MSDGAISLRLSRIPPLQRPTGPGRRDRAAIQSTTLLRGAESRVTALAELAHQHRPAVAHDEGATLLDVTARSLSESAEAIAGSPAQGQRADPDPSRVEDALARYLQRREARAASAEVDHDMAVRLRLAVAVEELAVWTRDLAVRVLDLWGWLTGVSFDSRRVADDVTGTTQLR